MSKASSKAAPNSSAQLMRVMGFWSLALYGAGDMLGAGIYGLIGKAAGQMGNAVWLAFLASMIAALCTGLTYAEIGSRYPKAAGSAYVVHKAFGRSLLSYIVGLTTLASGMVSMAAGARIVAGYLQASGYAPGSIGVYVVGFILLLTAINIWGMRESIMLNVFCTLVEVGGLVFIIAVGLPYWGGVNYLELPLDPVTNEALSLSPILVLQGAVLTFYSFVGFEDMLNVSEEVKDPERTFPRALIFALGITTLIYMAVSISAVSVVPFTELAQSNQPLVEVVVRAAPWFPAVIFSGIAVFAVSNTALLNFIMGSRLMYGMACHGLLPRLLSRVHATRRTPHIAILVMMLMVVVLALVGDISTLAKATSVLLLGVFIVVNVALIVIKRRVGEPQGRFRVPTFVPVLGVGVSLAMLANAKAGEFLIAGGLLVGIFLLYFIMRPKVTDDLGV